ncbi:MAG: SIMPL domain-containing protein [Nanoarchaeota archaeon]
MRKEIYLGLLVLGILIIGYFIINSGPSVSAQGSSVLKVKPDLVSVYITVETSNTTAILAQDANQEISDKLLYELVRIGFDKDELEFVGYNVYPEYDRYDYTKIKGYHVYQQLVVKTNETSKVPGIVDSAINSGALVSYINFELSEKKQNEYKIQALEEASRDAKLKAQGIAVGQGKKLGKLVSLGNQDYQYRGPIAMYSKVSASGAEDMAVSNAQAKEVAMDLNPQDTEVSANINAVYRLRLF